MPMRRIVQMVGRSVATISRVLAQLGLSSLNAIDPKEPVVRLELEAPGDLLRMDMKKPGRIATPGHRITETHPERASALPGYRCRSLGQLPAAAAWTLHCQPLSARSLSSPRLGAGL